MQGAAVADCCCNPLGSASVPAGPTSPFRGLYYVDPLFAGTTSTGSQANPFKTIAAAQAFAVTAAVANYTIVLIGNTTENVTFPLTGEVGLVGASVPGYSGAVTITGNVAIGASASARRYLSNLQITGNVTGNTSAGVHRITFERVLVGGTTTLTITAGATLRLGTLGGVLGGTLGTSNMFYNFFTGAVSVQGTIWGFASQFTGNVSCSGRCTFSNCIFTSGTTITTTAQVADDNDLIFSESAVSGVTINISQTVGGRLAALGATDSNLDSTTINFSGIGINVFNLDAVSANSFFGHGATFTGTVPNAPGTMSRARLTAQVNNIGLTNLAFKSPIPMLRATGTLTLVTPGTAGAAVLNVGYTDSLGVARVKAVTPALNIAGAAGDEVSGVLPFTQNGTANTQWSVTGIVTPGALSYNVAISLEPGM